MIVLLLFACTPQSLEFYTDAEGCKNWNPTEETEPYLRIYQQEGSLIVQRQGVEQYCDATFTPVIEQMNSYKIAIREYWDVSDNTHDCQTCLAPTVTFTESPNRKLEFWWYVGDNGISFDVIDTEDISIESSNEEQQ